MWRIRALLELIVLGPVALVMIAVIWLCALSAVASLAGIPWLLLRAAGVV